MGTIEEVSHSLTDIVVRDLKSLAARRESVEKQIAALAASIAAD